MDFSPEEISAFPHSEIVSRFNEPNSHPPTPKKKKRYHNAHSIMQDARRQIDTYSTLARDPTTSPGASDVTNCTSKRHTSPDAVFVELPPSKFYNLMSNDNPIGAEQEIYSQIFVFGFTFNSPPKIIMHALHY